MTCQSTLLYKVARVYHAKQFQQPSSQVAIWLSPPAPILITYPLAKGPTRVTRHKSDCVDISGSRQEILDGTLTILYHHR